MKNLIYLLLISLTILSCSKNDDTDDSLENPILGEWKLIKITSDGTYTPQLLDYSNKSIIYNFTLNPHSLDKNNYELIITGEENSGYPNGTYQYYFRENYLEPGPWGEDEQKVLLVAINGSKYSYNLTNGVMTLGQSHIKGGPDFVFEKAK